MWAHTLEVIITQKYDSYHRNFNSRSGKFDRGNLKEIVSDQLQQPADNYRGLLKAEKVITKKAMRENIEIPVVYLGFMTMKSSNEASLMTTSRRLC